MRKIKIVNPAAGRGDAAKFANNSDGVEIYYTKCIGDAERFCTETLLQNPKTHFIVYGGDGTVNEVVNGIMNANANDSALFSVIPVGTGNDLVKSFDGEGTIHEIDVIKYNDRYAVNVINIGFDCAVAGKASKLKSLPLINGSGAYIAGVVTSLAKHYGERIHVKLTTENGIIEFDDEYLICVIGNCSFYGGGFKAAPLAEYDDGLLDVLLVKKMPRYKFLALINDYRLGKHINPESMTPIDKFSKYATYVKCTAIDISDIENICVDGEVGKVTDFHAEVLKRKVRIMI